MSIIGIDRITDNHRRCIADVVFQEMYFKLKIIFNLCSDYRKFKVIKLILIIISSSCF